MRVRIEEPDGEKTIEDYITSHPIRIETGEGVVIVGLFNGDIQVVRVQGDVKSTMIKFNDLSLL